MLIADGSDFWATRVHCPRTISSQLYECISSLSEHTPTRSAGNNRLTPFLHSGPINLRQRLTNLATRQKEDVQLSKFTGAPFLDAHYPQGDTEASRNSPEDRNFALTEGASLGAINEVQQSRSRLSRQLRTTELRAPSALSPRNIDRASRWAHSLDGVRPCGAAPATLRQPAPMCQ
jgi:hypothetical protein